MSVRTDVYGDKNLGEEMGELNLNAPATTGAFYFFNQHHKPLNQSLIPGTIAM